MVVNMADTNTDLKSGKTGKYVVIKGYFNISSEIYSFKIYFLDDHDINDINYYMSMLESYLSIYFEGLSPVVTSITSIIRTNNVQYRVAERVAIIEFEQVGPKRPRSHGYGHGRRHLTKRYVDLDTRTFGYVAT
jgi:hypothetical protein